MAVKHKMNYKEDLQVPKSESCGFLLLLISWSVNASQRLLGHSQSTSAVRTPAVSKWETRGNTLMCVASWCKKAKSTPVTMLGNRQREAVLSLLWQISQTKDFQSPASNHDHWPPFISPLEHCWRGDDHQLKVLDMHYCTAWCLPNRDQGLSFSQYSPCSELERCVSVLQLSKTTISN